MTQSFDAVSLGIMWDRLVSIADEVVSTLVRTSFSLIVRENYDLSVVLLDAEGNSLAQGSYSVPSFTGTAPQTLKHMLKRFPAHTLKPGDAICTNDPWMGTGHLFDINVMRPVFRRGKLVGYTISVTHLPDIGGMGLSTTAREIFHEGIRLPICKLAEEGRLNEELLETIRVNVRAPEQVVGDLMANLACNEVGARQLVEFMDEYGVDDLKPLSAAIRGQCERAMRDKLRAMRDGVYESRLEIEGPTANEPVTLRARVDKQGDEVAIDFAGTGPQVPRGINVPFCYTRAMAWYAVKCLTAPNLPNNEGATVPIRLSAPEGCILNAQPPFPTGGRHLVGHFVVPLVMGALADAAPDAVSADPGMLNLVRIHGERRDGRTLSTLYFASGGLGALSGHDGPNVTPAPSNMAVTEVEIWESQSHVTVLSKRLLPDSGGPGAARGGLGQEWAMRNDTGKPLSVYGLAMRTQFAARGMHGGKPGALRGMAIDGEPADARGDHRLAPGAVMTVREAGGGGFGDPKQRPKAKVLADLAEGFVTPEGAARDYGVRT
jgi:N-methylhydantoinase B